MNLDRIATYLVPVGRVLFAWIFIVSAFGHFTEPMIKYAESTGVPLPQVLVPLSGLLALAGGISVAVGYRAKLGAWLLVLFLIPVTFMMHAFWRIEDPDMARMQQIMFLKNMSMLGAALLIAYFGSGPVSLQAKRDESGR